MKKLLLSGLTLFMCIYSSGQIQQATVPVATKYPELEKMTPGMTEIWEPEVKIIQPGVANSDAPSDAIVLFNGTDMNPEWTDVQGNPSKWIVKDGALISVKGAGFIKSRWYTLDYNTISFRIWLLPGMVRTWQGNKIH